MTIITTLQRKQLVDKVYNALFSAGPDWKGKEADSRSMAERMIYDWMEENDVDTIEPETDPVFHPFEDSVIKSIHVRAGDPRKRNKELIEAIIDQKVSNAITQGAIKMVILDAIEKGHTNPADLVEYMKSETFEAAVKRYVSLFKTIEPSRETRPLDEEQIANEMYQQNEDARVEREYGPNY